MDLSKLWDITMGAIGGAFTAALAMWFALTGRISKLEQDANECRIHQGEQKEQHKANLLRLSTIEGDVKTVLGILLERK